MDILIFIALCIIGWQCFEKLKIPTPTILGPMFALSTANFLGMHLLAPLWFKPSLSIIMGILIGLRFNLKLKGIIREILLVSGCILLVSFVTAQVLVYTGLTKATALFAAMPGGLAELTIVGMSYGANIFVVALLQSSRLLTTMLVIPAIVRRLSIEPETTQYQEKEETVQKKEWFWVLLLGVTSAYLLTVLNIPAASLIGPMLAVGIYTKVNKISLKINRAIQRNIQIGVGGLIGLNATKESILNIPDLIISIIFLNILIIGGSLLLGFLLHRMTGWDLATCLLSTAPAGLTPMILLSMELNVDSNRVVLFQLLRLVTVVLFAPLEGHLFLSG